MIVRDAWRLGVAGGTTRPDLGRFGLRDVPVQEAQSKPIYSNRELKEIIRFLVKRRAIPRGESLASERAYLANCICLISAFIPINRGSVFDLNGNSLHCGESDRKFDVIVITKNRPTKSVNRLPEFKPKIHDRDGDFFEIKRGKSEIRKIFEENRSFNKNMGRADADPLFWCIYDSNAAKYRKVYGRINDTAFRVGMTQIHNEFKVLADNGEPLKILLSKLRRSVENRLPDDVRMRDRAKVMNHKNLDTTGSVYETVTDGEHFNFHRGLKAISIAVTRSDKDAMVWARNAGLSPDTMERLLVGMLRTKVASCSDPISGEFSPKNGKNCTETLACFGCSALAVTVADLYRLASLERRIKMDLNNGILGDDFKSKFKIILEIIDLEIFSQFERRLVESAREKARRELHPMWKRVISLVAI
ncbi:hypothetical protein [Paraburkholderia tropica]|uniref:hypothetical protein n=1 Tax=Paraburkholderia tropica TaxID=92647 RepID=UPI002AB71B9A|nr:hypothetical protein [Paraburkholderia tropica]